MKLSNTLVATLGAVAAAAGAAEAADDRFAVSGGGGRACVTGLVALDVINDGKLEVPKAQMQGLSGGAWSVLVAESLGSKEALKRYSDWVYKKNKPIGFEYTTTRDASGRVWEGINRWESYVRSVIDEPLANSFAHDGNFEYGDQARVLVGAASSTVRQASDKWRMNRDNMDGSVTDIHCQIAAKGESARLACGHEPTRPFSSMKLHGITDKVFEWKFTRARQALATSTAWLGLTFGPRRPAPGLQRNNGLAVQLPVTPKTVRAQVVLLTGAMANPLRAQTSDHYQLYDQGLTCNIAVTPEEMLTEGVTLSIDASFDGANVQASMRECEQYWNYRQANYDYVRSEKLRTFTGTRRLSAFYQELGGFGIRTKVFDGKHKLKWFGREVDVSAKALGNLAPYVRVLQFIKPGTASTPTGRYLINIAFTRYNKDNMMGHLSGTRFPHLSVPVPDSERFSGLETAQYRAIPFVESSKSTTVPYGKTAFERMNVGGRAFFADVLKRMGVTDAPQMLRDSGVHTLKSNTIKKQQPKRQQRTGSGIGPQP